MERSLKKILPQEYRGLLKDGRAYCDSLDSAGLRAMQERARRGAVGTSYGDAVALAVLQDDLVRKRLQMSFPSQEAAAIVHFAVMSIKHARDENLRQAAGGPTPA